MRSECSLGPLFRLVSVVTALVSACGGSSPTQPTPPTPSLVMDGRIYETAPTDTTPVAGARVEIPDGPNVGRSATSTADGYYRIDGIQRTATSDTVTFNIRVSRANYETITQSVTLVASGSKNFFIEPSFQTITETLTGEVSDASPVCPGTTLLNDIRPCQRFAAPVHHDGKLTASMTYTAPQNSGNILGLLVCREPCRTGDVLDAASLSWFGSFDVFADVRPGVKYWVHVLYMRGATPQAFTLSVRRPN